ncbi:lysoplasmalogenase [Salinispirillum sp. LH 10-3-1]|uniref:Lysoplasmalogenase n=1 Tax=Salinispirillum sp. LH 10-3-1 TaxID=2952525 RepID=A0AB38YDK6_9GAMM
MEQSRSILWFYVIWCMAALGYVLNVYFTWFIPEVNWVLKPLPVLLLLFWVWRSVPAEEPLKLWLMVALGLSSIGDIVLLIPGQFIVGLAAFLLAHLVYLKVFAHSASMAHIRWLVIIVIICAGLLGGYLILPDLNGQMYFAVLAYMVTLGAMAIAATLCKRVHWIAIPGVLLFMFSDTVLGYSTLVSAIDNSDVVVMVSYYLAQFCLAHALIWYREPEEDPFAVA